MGQIGSRVLERCNGVVVLTLDGWQQSIGVQAELQIVRDLGKPAFFVSLQNIVPRGGFARMAPNLTKCAPYSLDLFPPSGPDGQPGQRRRSAAIYQPGDCHACYAWWNGWR
jgi:hypothetical protein